MAAAQGERIGAYRIRASIPNAVTSNTWETIWDTNAGVLGADLPVSSLRLTNRLSQPSELEFQMPRYDYRDLPVYMGDYYDSTMENIAPMFAIISVYRFGVAVFSGPVVSYRGSLASDSITVQCKDFTHFFERALVGEPTYATSSADIYTIVGALHNQWYNRSAGADYAALEHVIDPRRYTSVASAYTTTMGKNIAFRAQRHENLMFADALYQLSTIGGDGYQFQWWVEYVTKTSNPPQPRVTLVSPYAYYYPNTELEGHRLEAGEGTNRTCHTCEWVVDGANLANEYVVAGYGQGTSQQRARYTGPGTAHPAERAPLQAHIESDQTVRRNDHATNRAKAGWHRTRYPQMTLRMSWTADDWGGELPYNVVRPGSRLRPVVRDSFLGIQANREMEVSAWSLDVNNNTEVISADLFVPNY